MTRFYVYTLAYPEQMNGAVFYVGKGTGARMHYHEVNAATGETGPRADTIRAVWDAGYQVVKTVVAQTDDELEAFRIERKTMREYAGNLTNRRASPIAGPKHQKNVILDERSARELEELEAHYGLTASELFAEWIHEAYEAMLIERARIQELEKRVFG